VFSGSPISQNPDLGVAPRSDSPFAPRTLNNPDSFTSALDRSFVFVSCRHGPEDVLRVKGWGPSSAASFFIVILPQNAIPHSFRISSDILVGHFLIPRLVLAVAEAVSRVRRQIRNDCSSLENFGLPTMIWSRWLAAPFGLRIELAVGRQVPDHTPGDALACKASSPTQQYQPM